MYNVILNVINTGIYELNDIIKKINTIWLQGDITDDQKDELIIKARENADMTQSINLVKQVEELTRNQIDILARLAKVEGGSEPSEDYPPYVDGKWYYNGDKITFQGKKYVCVVPEGQVCTWSPEGYPVYWEEVL